jgi:hypothetical protein
LVDTGRIIAEFRDYPGMLDALRARALELKLCVSDDENLALMGLPSNYISKLLRPKPVRRIGPHSLGPILGGFGVKLVMVEDVAAMARLRMLSDKYGKALKTRNGNLVRADSTHVVFSWQFMRKIRRKGGLARAAKLTARQRSDSARNAAMARWRKPAKAVRI